MGKRHVTVMASVFPFMNEVIVTSVSVNPGGRATTVSTPSDPAKMPLWTSATAPSRCGRRPCLGEGFVQMEDNVIMVLAPTLRKESKREDVPVPWAGGGGCALQSGQR